MLKDLKTNSKNPRKITKQAFEKLKSSVSSFSKMLEVRPIAYDEDGVIWGGNQRYLALKDLVEAGAMEDREEFYKLLAGFSEAEKKEFAIRDNIEYGEWDLDILASDWNDVPLKDWGLDLSQWGKKRVIEDEPPALSDEMPKSKDGEVYVLGRHRLMCGDSTNADHLAKLMNGELGDMVFTDPPYNVNYDYTITSVEGRARKDKFKSFNDSRTDVDFEEFIRAVFTNAYLFTKESAAFYCWHASKTEYQFKNGIQSAGWHVSLTLQWLKDRATFSKGLDYMWMTEPCYFGWKKGNKHFINRKVGDYRNIVMLDSEEFLDHLNLIYLNKDKITDYVHPTQKPVRLGERAIQKHSPIDGIVLELFGGSGSTLMACEQLDRSCYAIELDPKYCDLIRRRYAKFIGKELEWETATQSDQN